ncbi:LysM peptidoglycan-binding domain-containing protein [Verrucomicrobia bacterium]|nr:LysM peptidoglycan-binding domain-containing protein [Verrucomicrobiota bacterium]
MKLWAIAWLAALLVGCGDGKSDATAEDREPHFLAGRQMVTQQDYDGAEKSFYKALEANPRSSAAHYELGVLFLSRKNDPAAAIFHLQRYLILKPAAENKKAVLGQIEGLKSDLAGEILGNPQSQPNRSIQALRTQLNHLAAENAALKHQLLSKGITPNPATTTNSTTTLPRPGGGSSVPNPPRPTTTTLHTHKVKQGDNPTSIARQYGITVPKLLAANPGLKPSRMQIGDELKIPPRN